MANEFVEHLRPNDFKRESAVGYDPSQYITFSGDVPCLPFPKLADQGYTCVVPVPAGLTIGTGFTFHLYVVDDGMDSSDLGKVVRFGLTVKRLIDGETSDIDSGAGTEQTKDVTLDATSGKFDVSTLAIANANLDSTATGEAFLFRIRRIGTASQDTCNGRVLLAGVKVVNT